MSDMDEAYLGQALAGDREHWSGPPEMVDRIAAAVGTRPDDVVLDIGAGLGGPARRLARLTGCRVFAVDALPDVLLQAKRRLHGSSSGRERVTFVAGSAVSLPLRSEVADQVWSLGVVAHIEDNGKFAHEVFRVLRPGGVLALTESFWEGLEVPRFARSAPQPWRALRSTAVVSSLAGAGLEGIEVGTWPGHGISGSLDSVDPSMRADLADGRIVPLMITGYRR
ncbi:MAG TPA: methyltransferase domain-containing protein [Actinomycetota bacterium]|nr:methyltransferase domain-containing protein [Actinomycetota bacterium]